MQIGVGSSAQDQRGHGSAQRRPDVGEFVVGCPALVAPAQVLPDLGGFWRWQCVTHIGVQAFGHGFALGLGKRHDVQLHEGLPKPVYGLTVEGNDPVTGET